MSDGYVEKQVSESFAISVSFANNLVENEKITSADVSAYLNEEDVSNEIIVTSTIISNVVYIKLQGGKNGRRYKITVVGHTSDGNTFESDVMLKIVNI